MLSTRDIARSSLLPLLVGILTLSCETPHAKHQREVGVAMDYVNSFHQTLIADKYSEIDNFMDPDDAETCRQTILHQDTLHGSLVKTMSIYCDTANRILDKHVVQGFHVLNWLIYDSCSIEEEMFIDQTEDGLKITWIAFRPTNQNK